MAECRKLKRQNPYPNKAERKNQHRHDVTVQAQPDSLSRLLFEALPLGVVLFDCNLKIIQANSCAAKLIRLGRYIDKSLAGTKNSKATARMQWSSQLKSVLATGTAKRFEKVTCTLSHNDNTKLLSINCIPLPNDTCKSATEPALAKNNCISSPAGVVIIEDTTEKAARDKRLAEAERLAAIGKLVSRVAHELNNPIDGILRYINLAIRVIEQHKLEKPKDYLDQCRRGLMRMVQILNELLEFSAGTGFHYDEYTRVEQIIEDAVKTMEPQAERSKIKIKKTFSQQIPEVAGVNLFQVFVNIIKNALEAMPDGGQLNISTYLSGDNMAVVEFEDTGGGFEPENRSAIFEPFFTTKTKTKGTGLGLAICKDIITRHNGRITARNGPKGGSIFAVHLPIKTN